MKTAVRMDDITPDMNWENFRFFQELFEKAGIKPLLGIVPENKDGKLSIDAPRQDFYALMKKLQERGYVLAMHGCCHVYTTKRGGLFPLNNYSEFAGLPYEKQKELLAAGKEKLTENGIETDIFMAPAHSYDKNTLRALRELGFTGVTDGFGFSPYRYEGLTFYPISLLSGKDMKRKKEGTTTVVIHANTLTEADKTRYRKLFETYGKHMISYSEYLKIPPVKRGLYGRAAEYLLARAKYCLVRLKK
ncbi:MAG: DUF2334 domain-containing protein [Blautia sp.]|nr:DUF2334 domain-containing protein [Blautia sp.]MCM1200893.1 DUF2334 domain-containing protein [Bacteroides fragilis]